MPAETTMMYFHAASMLPAALEADEECADERGQLDRDPVDTDIVHDRADQRAARSREERIEVGSRSSCVEQPHVANRIDRSEAVHEGGASEGPRASASTTT